MICWIYQSSRVICAAIEIAISIVADGKRQHFILIFGFIECFFCYFSSISLSLSLSFIHTLVYIYTIIEKKK